MFQGQSLRVTGLEPVGIFELCFDRAGDAINRFDERTVAELREATRLLAGQPGLRGVLVTSAKEVFIVGADITEFGAKFDKAAEAIAADLASSNEVFVAFEDLQVPSVCAINGVALGGGLEFALTTSVRVMSTAAQVGVPEVKLGLFPGFGGTVRLARVDESVVVRAVAYAAAMGKTPIVVSDCPGFLVNRVFTAYIRAFLQLLADGADFEKVDAAMEDFGWPMGPAYLEDVIGMDTGSHVNDVISTGYPARMPPLEHDALRLMAGLGRLGQKSGLGFYRYQPDPQGRPRRSAAGDTHGLLARLQQRGARTFAPAEIVDRMMLPMAVEAAHALEEGVVATAGELDTALLLGLGFPAYAGGPLQYADWLGPAEVVTRCDRLRALGPAYEATPRMRAMAAGGVRYHGRFGH